MRLTRFLLSVLLLLGLVAGALGPATTSVAFATTGPVIDPELTASLTGPASLHEVIVTFHGDGAPTAQHLALLQQAGITTGITLHSLPMAGVLATSQQVDALAASPAVRSLWLNTPVTYYNGDATDLTGVDRLRTDTEMTTRNGGLPVSGKGIGVVINDSGVDGTHNDHKLGRNLKQNVLGSTNLRSLSNLLPITWVEDLPNTDSNSGHGTHVTGTVGGTGAMSSGQYEGAAPGASLVGYGSGGVLLVLDTIGGFDYAMTHQAEYGIRVITNSWGSSGGFDPEHPVNRATYEAYKRNMVVLFAAGNEGPGEDTHNPYAKAPWVISVAAGDKQGMLASFSSRGSSSGGSFTTYDGRSWTWQDQPAVTAPGVDIISTRVIAPLGALAADADAAMIEPAHLPYYTSMSGTSMATPHVAGIVALMLEANARLTPDQVKQILQETATNMPGRKPYEVGAGYVNAYAAVDRSFREDSGYGSTLNLTRSFNSQVATSETKNAFTVPYDPALPKHSTFTVAGGATELVAKIYAEGLLKETGNTLNLVLTAPNGTEYSSGVNLLFPLYWDRTVAVTNPMAGTWKAEVRGLRGDTLNPIGVALPETVSGTLTLRSAGGYTGLSDIAGHPAEASVKLCVSLLLCDGRPGGTFGPDDALTRRNLAHYLTMGAGVRQSLPISGAATFSDVAAADRAFAEAVAARGAALRDRAQQARGVMLPTGAGTFAPNLAVSRADLAYSLVQSLGLEAEAVARNGQSLTVQYGSERIAIEDAAEVPAHVRGYIQIALDMNILNAYFHTTQGPFDLQPVLHANFRPAQQVSRGEFAVAITRFYNAYLMP